jgi:hypothetical protein
MAKYKRAITMEKINRWIKEGRGDKDGAEYKPWLTIQDVPSRGRCHRIRGWRHGRVHHLLSDLEANVFYTYEWSRKVIEIKEQFPLLPLDETLSIAEEIGVPHPIDPVTKHPIVMSTDLVLKINCGLSFDYFARQVKYASSLNDPRTGEKLEIERRYWLRRDGNYGIITERDVHMALVYNIKWVHPRYELADLSPLTEQTVRKVAQVLTEMVMHDDTPLRKITSICDSRLGLQGGDSMKVVRHLIAIRYWQVDMSERLKPGKQLVLLNVPRHELYEEEMLVA